mgnify:CR=1 FL=1
MDGILKKKRSDAADKKSDREIGAGAVGSYIHNTNEVGALVLLGCETDFVSKNPEFVELAKEIAMHVAAINPTYVKREDVPEEEINNHPEKEASIPIPPRPESWESKGLALLLSQDRMNDFEGPGEVNGHTNVALAKN